MSVGWSYRKTTNGLQSDGAGFHCLSLFYATLADSLAQPTPTDGMPSDQFVRVPRRFRVNEHAGATASDWPTF